MGELLPLTQRSRHSGLQSRCCLGYHILAVISLQCRCCLSACKKRGDREWEPPGTAKNDQRLFSITRCSLWWFWSTVLCRRVIFKGHDIYSRLPFSSFSHESRAPLASRVYLHYFLFECWGIMFISNRARSVCFSLCAHAPIKLDISCLQSGRRFVSVKSACLSVMQLQSFKLKWNHKLDPGVTEAIMLERLDRHQLKVMQLVGRLLQASPKTPAHSSCADGPFFM